MAQAITVPNVLEVLSGETLNLQVDFTNVIATGDVISGPTAVMFSLQNKETFPISINAPTIITGNIIQLTLTTSKLRVGNDYALVWSVIATGGTGTKNVSVQLTIMVIQ